ncbi:MULTISPECIES: hypothetical protein [unclassified Beijerinckia]|uniref:hypothetical protein n=1 Tax=unclassified Beijerinckia TaxID=2638183 RepID=UPI0008943E07|nr:MULTISPECIES: hypothetical protein [unclassified Beijerinckia]MDH7794202.1 hypothetical protein [Beijerinckia sp. GAS462]SEB55637.1 hypothetical protein SAMN05443249_0467 [Beijerinckia sp. 28-YEA-48]
MTQFNIALSPLVPTLVLVLLALGAIIVIGLSFWARRKGAWLRALGLGLILFSLADPSLVREDRDPLKDVVAVVLDRSASQSIGERTAQTDQAKEQIEKSLAALGNVETRVVEAGGGDADVDGTRLFSALSSALADVPPERVGGAFIVTDGVVHDIPAHPDLLGFKAPVHAFITGHEGERDRRIELVEAPRFGLVGKDQTITARILDSADRGEPVELVVRRDGAEISRQRVRTGATIRVNVRVEHGGPNVVELEVATLDDELTALNNKAVVTIEGVRDKLKVLLVSGEPHAGERTWRNLLKADANVDLVHFTILRPPEKSGLDGTPISELSLIAFPTADLFGRKIREFDLIIFDRYSNQTVLPPVYFENIVRFVREGGALLIAAGPDYSGRDGLFFSPLGKIAPARPSGDVIERAFRAHITAMGNKHPVTRGLPGGAQTPPAWSEWFRQVDAEPLRGTSVLSGVDDKPLLLLSREEKGRVGLLLSDQIWLWARNYQNGGPHLELLRRLAHWLMKEPELEEEALRATARGREISIERQSLKDVIEPVTVTSPSGNSQIVTLKEGEPGLSRAQVRVGEPGLYKLTDGELTALVNVGAENPVEFREVVSTMDKLRPLVEATGGTIRRISAGSGDAISLPRFTSMRDSPLYGGSDYVAIRRTGASVVTGIGVAPLAIGFLGLLALLGSVLIGWLWESRRRGPA